MKSAIKIKSDQIDKKPYLIPSNVATIKELKRQIHTFGTVDDIYLMKDQIFSLLQQVENISDQLKHQKYKTNQSTISDSECYLIEKSKSINLIKLVRQLKATERCLTLARKRIYSTEKLFEYSVDVSRLLQETINREELENQKLRYLNDTYYNRSLILQLEIERLLKKESNCSFFLQIEWFNCWSITFVFFIILALVPFVN